MAHESFEDTEVAEVLNNNFICIKVDREEHPEVDAVYMTVCQVLTGSGGWPLTVVLAPDQKPFFAGTYFPKHSKYGQIGLLELLSELMILWKTRRKELIETGEQMVRLLSETDRTKRKILETKEYDSLQMQERGIEQKLIDQAAASLKQSFDSRWGGFGSAPKFPVPHMLLFLLYRFLLQGDKKAKEMAEKTLDGIACGGIQDLLEGGFSRYSTDEKWLIPHFEKMLYDNALLSLTYLEASEFLDHPEYKNIAAKALHFIEQELTGPEGEFYCGLDADSEGEEGSYYLFTREEVLQVLGKNDGREFLQRYGMEGAAHFEGKYLPNRIELQEPAWEETDPRLLQIAQYRRSRPKPHRDDKVLTSWNAWTILAFAKAAQCLEPKEAYQKTAKRAEQFLQNHLVQPDGRLFLRWRENEAANDGQLEDYAVYGLALTELYKATYQPGYLKTAVGYAIQMIELFEDPKSGGYFMTAHDAQELIFRPKETYDGAIPSGNSAAAVLLLRLAELTKDTKLQSAADRQIKYLTEAVNDDPAGSSFGLLALLGAVYPQAQLICVSADTQMPKDLKDYLYEQQQYGLSVLWKTRQTQTELEQVVPWLGKYPIPAEGTVYYLCEHGSCMAPETDFNQLTSKLRQKK